MPVAFEKLITGALAFAIVVVISAALATILPSPPVEPDAVDAATITSETPSGSRVEVALRGRLSL
jgi:hypothetical protein